MTRLKGKVKSIAVTEVAEGQQVCIAWKNGLTIHKTKLTGAADYMRTLVVEYEDLKEYRQDNPPFSGPYPPTSDYRKQLSLKYSQWQSAIDNGEVDSDKEVEFEVVSTSCDCIGMCKHDNPDKDCTNKVLAKIIPQRLSEFRDKYADMYVGANRKKIALDLNEHAIPIIPLGLIFNIGGIDYFGATDNKGRNLSVIPTTGSKKMYSEEDMKAAFESEGHTLEFKDWLSSYNKRN